MLLAMVESGDRDALDQITRCYGNRLLEIGKKQCRDESLAQDALQDALVSAATHLDDFRGEGSLEGWLGRMVTNACRRMKRGLKGNASIHIELPADQQSDAMTPDEIAAQSRLGDELVHALQILDPKDRGIVLLAEVNGWKGPEIAEALHMTPSQVRTRLSRSRQRLRLELADIGSAWGLQEKKSESGDTL
jgi:RNA polymerase sigma-70 factor (ECF subfamily)